MIRWFPIIKKFPQTFVAILIVFGSSALFMVWWMLRKPSNSCSTGVASQVARPEDFRLEDVVLCGNTLVNFKTGKVLAPQWLDGFGNVAPPLLRIQADRGLVICGSRGEARAFTLQGEARPEIQFEGKPVGAAAYSFGDSKTVFVRAGNLWLGHVDWLESRVTDAKRITDVGYFRDDAFRGDWLWHRDTLFVPVLGRTHRIDLITGEIRQEQMPIGVITRGVNADATFAAVPIRKGFFAVVNLATAEARQIPLKGLFREFVWLDSNRLAYAGIPSELLLYDADSNRVEGPFVSPAPITKLAGCSADGHNLLLVTGREPTLFDRESHRFVGVGLPLSDASWISDDLLLCSCPSSDTAIRGIWKVEKDGRKTKITDRPVDNSVSGKNRDLIISVPGGGVWVSEGNLWFFDLASGIASQTTAGLSLPSNLQILAR